MLKKISYKGLWSLALLGSLFLPFSAGAQVVAPEVSGSVDIIAPDLSTQAGVRSQIVLTRAFMSNGTWVRPALGNNTITIVLLNRGYSGSVLVDLELYDQNNNKIAQKFFDNTVIPVGQTKTFQLSSPENLANGTYRFAVGVFYPNWGGLIKWWNAIRTFDVSPRGTVSLVSVSPIASQIEAGHSQTFAARFKNSNWAGQVLIDFELFDAAGNKVAQKAVDKQSFAPSESKTYYFTTPSLPAGSYRLAIGVFKSNWRASMDWNDAAASLWVESEF